VCVLCSCPPSVPVHPEGDGSAEGGQDLPVLPDRPQEGGAVSQPSRQETGLQARGGAHGEPHEEVTSHPSVPELLDKQHYIHDRRTSCERHLIQPALAPAHAREAGVLAPIQLVDVVRRASRLLLSICLSLCCRLSWRVFVDPNASGTSHESSAMRLAPAEQPPSAPLCHRHTREKGHPTQRGCGRVGRRQLAVRRPACLRRRRAVRSAVTVAHSSVGASSSKTKADRVGTHGHEHQRRPPTQAHTHDVHSHRR
jgi:hypothetical protein